MVIQTIENKSENVHLWDNYVQKMPESNIYHLSGWRKVIENTYGHKTYYLMAFSDEDSKATDIREKSEVVGVLPMVHLKHIIFGNRLVSIPYFDMGGIIADKGSIGAELFAAAVDLGRKLDVDEIEFRHTQPLPFWGNNLSKATQNNDKLNIEKESLLRECTCKTRSHKVRMVMKLPQTSEILMKSFKSKLRSQIKKPIKTGLYTKIGGMELINDFYKVFSINMRDLGSPVHSIEIIKNVLKEFTETSKIIMVYDGDHPVACSLVLEFKETLENPWASALKKYSRQSPNMLLYWSMMEYACEKGLKMFDFGRSSPDEGTYKFKEQWGAEPELLFWQTVYMDGNPEKEDTQEKSKYGNAMQIWSKLPVPVTRVIGPRIRKFISL